MKKCATFSPVHSITTTAVPLYDTVNRDCLLTCKCPWYILSTQSVADLSVSGCSDFFQTCEVDCQAVSVDMRRCGRVCGAELSSPRVLKLTLCARPGFLCVGTPRRAGRTRPTADCTFTVLSLCADAGLLWLMQK